MYTCMNGTGCLDECFNVSMAQVSVLPVGSTSWLNCLNGLKRAIDKVEKEERREERRDR